MPDDLMTETAEDKAAIEAMKNETPIELVQPEPEPAPAEAKPAEEPKPAAEAAPAEPKAEPKKPVRLVPHEALHEERTRRRELEARLRELESKVAPQQPVAEPIDESQNPIGAIGELKAKIARLEGEREQETRAQREALEIVSKVRPRVEAYKAEHPEYDDQFAFVRSSRFREYQAMRIYSDEQIAQMVQGEEMALAKHALVNDLDPGEVIANLAVARGWQAKTADPAPAAPAKPAADPKPAAEKIERIARGQRAAISSSGSGGATPASDDLSIEDLIALDGAAFDKAAASFIRAGKRAGA